MTEHDLDVLLGRLAVHYEIVPKNEVATYLARWREAAGESGSFGEFLTAEAGVESAVIQKLERAREVYLERSIVEPVKPGKEQTVGDDHNQETELESEIEDLSPTLTIDTSPRFDLRYSAGISLAELLGQLSRMDASDLHIHSGAPLKIRVNGSLRDTSEVIPRDEAERLILGILDQEQKEILEDRLQLDFAFALAGVGRFRASTYRQQRGLDAVFRSIPLEPPSLAELGLPEDFEQLTNFHQGIVLLTGPAGCGKSSTMAALVKLINERRADHIITVEDPIEYVHESARCVVNQRQVGRHTGSFARALRAALREDPDVIAIGELRDLETISLALTAAETGHLVLSTLHTNSAIRTLNRLLGVFPPQQQAQIRTMISESLRAIVSQRLVPRSDGKGRVPALEVLFNNRACANLIRESKTFQIKSVMQTGSALGMCLLDGSLRDLLKARTITRDTALAFAEDPKRIA